MNNVPPGNINMVANAIPITYPINPAPATLPQPNPATRISMVSLSFQAPYARPSTLTIDSHFFRQNNT